MEFLERGICRLGIVPVRSAPGDTCEMVNQLLFGEHYTVLELSDSKEWIRIKAYFDEHEGWINSRQHHRITEDYFNQINNSDYKISLDISSSILYRKNTIHIVMGSILPISTNELFKMEEKLAFNGESKSLGQKREFEFLKQVAGKYLNSPYLWGGKSPFGIDCSGFVQQVFKVCGYKLPRDSHRQAEIGTKIDELPDVLPGDIAFFKNSKGKIAHVGIILEDGNIIHASGQVRIDKLTEHGIVDEKLKQLTHKLFSIKRILKTL
ncbi:MAG TPA: C40 family peptidase [Cyclobacteriaceae bacterium]|jgi:hypothetical protein